MPDLSRTVDSPRWCEKCQKYGDHHTDRHPDLGSERATICPRCEGDGELFNAAGYEPLFVRCLDCDGTGLIPMEDDDD